MINATSPRDRTAWRRGILFVAAVNAAIGMALTAPRAGAQCQALRWTLNNPAPAAEDHFGSSAISGNNVLIGASGDDAVATDTGIAYLFDAATGTILQTFNNPTPAAGDEFGASLAISGNNVLVGAYKDDTGATNAGSAYLFDAATGALLRTFNNPTPATDDQFGNSVAISGTNILVGAPYDDTAATDAGSAYLFDASTGAFLMAFNNPTAAAGDHFGWSVDISGNNVLIGADLDDTGGTDAGSAYLFDASTGSFLRTFNNPTPAAGDRFGFSTAISGNNVLIGAFGDDSGATNAGSAYLFDASTASLLRTFNNPTRIGNILSHSPNLNESSAIALA